MADLPKANVAAAKAFVSISIDVDADVDATSHSAACVSTSSQQSAIESVTAQLIAHSDQSRMPATWAFSSFATPAVRRIADSATGHELALLSDAKLGKTELSRGDIMQNVVHPLQMAGELGHDITTLAVPQAWQPRHFDLLTKYGVTVIRTPHVFSSQTTTGIRAVCHGLWQVPVSVSMQTNGWIANLGQWRNVRRAVDFAVCEGGWCHLRIDAASIARGDVGAGLRNVARLLEHLYHVRSAGHISIETLRAAAVRLSPKRSAAPAGSILRAA
ncbi:MAG TPA: hypothetical protein VGI75_11855 [Pirellulales bacterium]